MIIRSRERKYIEGKLQLIVVHLSQYGSIPTAWCGSQGVPVPKVEAVSAVDLSVGNKC